MYFLCSSNTSAISFGAVTSSLFSSFFFLLRTAALATRGGG